MKILERQPYTVTLNDIPIKVCKHVFPPDLGRATQSLAKVLATYSPTTALDMGCGTGFLALVMKRNGANVVWAADIDESAVACAKKNSAANSNFGLLEVIQSDLLTEIPLSVKFDLIVFHQPYFPAKPTEYFTGVLDGGYEIIKRFLHQVPAYLNKNGIVIMVFQDSVGDEHDPKQIAKDLGFSVRTVLHEFYDNANHFIYEIKLLDST